MFGAALLRHHLGASAVPHQLVHDMAAALIASGRNMSIAQRRQLPSARVPPLMYRWPGGASGDPYLGAAHGLMGILYVLLHFPELLWGDKSVNDDVASCLDFVLSQECDLPDRPAGSGGCYPGMAASH